MKTFLYSLAVVILIMVGVFIFMSLRIDTFLHEKCIHLVEEASKEDRISYIEKWVAKNALGKGYSNVRGYDGRIYTILNGDIIYLEVLDWEYLGIKPEHGHLSLEKAKGQYENLLSKENLETIEYGSGRDSVIIKVNYTGSLTFRNRQENSAHFKKISEKVFVYCDGAKF